MLRKKETVFIIGLTVLFCLRPNVALAWTETSLKNRNLDRIQVLAPNTIGVPAPTEFIITPIGSVPQEAIDALEHAANSILAYQIVSTVPIEIELRWEDLEDPFGGTKLADAVSIRSWAGEGMPDPCASYPIALANAIRGFDQDSPRADISIRFDLDDDWYFGTDGNSGPQQPDFVTIALHELLHGLGFKSSMTIEDFDDGEPQCLNGALEGEGCWGNEAPEPDDDNCGDLIPKIYDVFLKAPPDRRLIESSEFTNPSEELAVALTDDVYFIDGQNLVVTDSGGSVLLYSPNSWSSGSSISHLDDGLFPAGSVGAMMTHDVGTHETYHRVDNLVLAILESLGWPMTNDHFRNGAVLEGASGSAEGNNLFATREDYEAIHGGAANAGSVWWEWTAPWSGQVTFDTMGSNFDTILAVYTGSDLSSLTEVASDSSSPGTASVTFEAVGGTEYKIAVDGPEESGTGEINLEWDLTLGTADLAVELVPDSVSVPLGETTTFTSTVTNLGPSAATSVQLFKNLLNFEFLASNSPECTVPNPESPIVCQVDSLPVGTNVQFEVTAIAVESGSTVAISNVTALENEIIPADNNSSYNDLHVTTESDIQLLVTNLTNPVIVGDEIRLLINILNGRPSVLTEVSLEGEIPDGTSFSGASDVGACSSNAQSFSCSVADISPGQTVPLEISLGTEATGSLIATILLSGMDEMAQAPFQASSSVLTRVLQEASPGEQFWIAEDVDRFGHALAIQDRQAFVGGHFENSCATLVEEAGIWTYSADLEVPSLWPDARFGISVDVDGDTLAVGDELGREFGISSTGAVHIFSKQGESWNRTDVLLPEDGDPYEAFGTSVSLDGSTIAVGSPGDNNSGIGGDSGSVTVFNKIGTEWVLDTNLINFPIEGGAQFGSSVALSGDVLAGGAPFEDTVAGEDSGRVRIFRRQAGEWATEQVLSPDDTFTDNYFGRSLAFDQDGWLLAGSVRGVYIFQHTGSGWVQRQKVTAGANALSWFGKSVATAGSLLVVGWPYVDAAATNDGAAVVFEKLNGEYVQREILLGSQTGQNSLYGWTVATDGDWVGVGTLNDDTVYFYTLPDENSEPSLEVTSQPISLSVGDSFEIEWVGGFQPTDSVALAMKRDSVSPAVSEPDGVDWFRFSESTPNDGAESISIPEGISLADDWRLYVRHIDSGAFAATESAFDVIDPRVDLSLEVNSFPSIIAVGETKDFQVAVRNQSLNAATQTVLSVDFPAELTFVSSNRPDICTEQSGVLNCNIDTLEPSGELPAIEILTVAQTVGVWNTSFSVVADQPDSNATNNEVEVRTEVLQTGSVIFFDGFETGGTSGWSVSFP